MRAAFQLPKGWQKLLPNQLLNPFKHNPSSDLPSGSFDILNFKYKERIRRLNNNEHVGFTAIPANFQPGRNLMALLFQSSESFLTFPGCGLFSDMHKLA